MMILVVMRFEDDDDLCQNWPSKAKILTSMIIAKIFSILCIFVLWKYIFGEGSLQFDSAKKTNPDIW